MRLEIRNLSFYFGRRLILGDISFAIPAGAVVSLVGPNGSGKTTLLRCIVGSLDFQSGLISVDGQRIYGKNSREIADRIGYVPQMEINGFPATVFDTVLLGRRPYIHWNPSDHDLDVVSETLVLLDLEEFALRDITELSGGEKQKVLIARAIAREPEMLVLDEPTASLDLKHQLEILELINRLTRQNGISVIMAMHDLNLAAMYSDRIVMIKQGGILGDGPPKELMTVENIRLLYGVDVSVTEECGIPQIVLPPGKSCPKRKGVDISPCN